FECRKGEHVLFHGSTLDNLLLIDTNPFSALSINSPSPIDIHRALGHPSLLYLKKAFTNLQIKDLSCTDCDIAKMHRQPFQGKFPTFHTALDCIHMDLCGPITPVSKGGNQYFLKIIDSHTKYCFIFPMRCKSYTFQCFTIFLHQAETSSAVSISSCPMKNGMALHLTYHA
ncbi:uncharacterized protein VP01_10286g1, partial [Puccinia sorghi]